MTPNPADAKVAKTTTTTPVYKAAPAPAPSCNTNAAPKAVRDLRIGDNKPSADAKTAEVCLCFFCVCLFVCLSLAAAAS